MKVTMVNQDAGWGRGISHVGPRAACLRRRDPYYDCWVGLLVLSLFAGCNRSGLDLAPVEGLVTFQGVPLADAGILFVPDDGPRAIGVTDSAGKFTLSSANEPGALIGTHRVAISKDETIAIPQQRGFPLYQTKNHIPPKYSDPALSGLTADVQDHDNFIEFKLEAK